MPIFVAMPILKSARQLDLLSLERSIGLLSGIRKFSSATTSERVVEFHLDEVAINAIVINKELPWKELEEPCNTCRIWPEATQEVRTHSAHAIVTASHNTAEPKQLAWYLTKGIEALLPSLDSIGVYWGSGTVVSSTKAFMALSPESSLDSLPLYLWIDFRCFAESNDRVSFFTSGMKALGFMEIEIKNSARKPAELLDLVYNLAHYLLDNGPVIKDGQTFGLSANELIPVHHVASFVNPSDTVYSLDL